MNTDLIKIAAADIEKNQKALEWLNDYGHHLNDKSCFKVSLAIYSASACVGATEATDVLSSYAASMMDEILEATKNGCANTIEIRREQIKREIGE